MDFLGLFNPFAQMIHLAFQTVNGFFSPSTEVAAQLPGDGFKLKFLELISLMMPFNCSIERGLFLLKVLAFNDLTQLLKRIGVLLVQSDKPSISASSKAS